MGNTSLTNQFKSGKWQIIQNIGNRQVLENIQTHMRVEKHYSISDFRSFQDRFKNTQLYNWRKSLDQSVNIVKLYEFEIKEQRFGIQEDQYVYTETISRFNQKAKNLSKAEGFLLLLDFCLGFQILFKTFGLFNIDIFLLGVSQNGKGKVWLNQNYAKNKIDEKNVIQNNGQNTELIIVNNLTRLVKDKIYNQDFMPQIQLPSNMYLGEMIQYLMIVRKQHVLFRVDKIYSDRNQFKQHYDMLYKQYNDSIQQPNAQLANLVLQSQSAPQQTPQHLTLQNNQKILQRNKSQSFMKIKKQPSETLSSDSNSRTKKLSHNTNFQNQQNLQQEHHKVAQNEKIHLKDMLNMGKNLSQNNQNIFYPNDLQRNQAISIKREAFNGSNHGQQNMSQNKSFIPQVERNIPIHMMQHQFNKYPLHFQHQIMQPQLPPGNYIQPRSQERPLFQQRVVQYRQIINPHQMQQISYQPIGIQQPNPPIIMQNQQNKYIQLQNPQIGYRPLQNIPGPFFEKNDSNQKANSFQMANRNFANSPINNEAFFTRKNEQQFIDNVQICESQIFDRAQLLQNLADLER